MTSKNVIIVCLLVFNTVCCTKISNLVSSANKFCPGNANVTGDMDPFCWQAGSFEPFKCSIMSFTDNSSYLKRLAEQTKCNVVMFTSDLKRMPNGQDTRIEWPARERGYYMVNGDGASLINAIAVPKQSHTPRLGTLIDGKKIDTVDMLVVSVLDDQWRLLQKGNVIEDFQRIDQLLLSIQKVADTKGILHAEDKIRSFVRTYVGAGFHPMWIRAVDTNGHIIQNLWELKYRDVMSLDITLCRNRKHNMQTPSSPGVIEKEYTSRDATKKQPPMIRSCAAPHKNKVTAVLSRSFSSIEGYTALIDRTKSIFACSWSESFDHVIFHDGGISLSQQQIIKKRVNNPSLIFHNLSALFQRRYTYPIGNATLLSDIHKCPPYVDEKKSAGYYVMCSFWYSDFLDTLCGRNYDYMLRIDDDNVVTTCADPTLPPNVPFASPANTGMDFPWVIQGMNDFMRVLVKQPRSKQLKLRWPKWTWDSPYTSVMWLNMKYLRQSPEYNFIRHRVEQSKCIFSSRWGDLPLWGATAQLMNYTAMNNTFVPLSYKHGSLRHTINPGKYVVVQNTDF